MKTPSPSILTFKQFNDEINDFYKYLKDNKFSEEEIRKILEPLLLDFKRNNQLLAVVATTVILIVTLYFATYIETISWNLSAIGRILLIKLLPYWDWTVLKNERCLIRKFTSSTIEEIRFNCDLCENINQIDVYNDISADLLKDRYLDVDIPVIIKKSWPKSPTFIDEILKNDIISNSKPCSLATNVCSGTPSIKNLLIKTQIFDSFFIHFQNCDFNAMKQFRGFTPRPMFTPPELSPVQYNWLLWSKNYNVTHFKTIPLVEKFALVGQILGGNFIRLVPRKNCEKDCPAIELKLKEEETVVFTSLWDLEYRPDWGENLAAILEMH